MALKTHFVNRKDQLKNGPMKGMKFLKIDRSPGLQSSIIKPIAFKTSVFRPPERKITSEFGAASERAPRAYSASFAEKYEKKSLIH